MACRGDLRRPAKVPSARGGRGCPARPCGEREAVPRYFRGTAGRVLPRGSQGILRLSAPPSGRSAMILPFSSGGPLLPFPRRTRQRAIAGRWRETGAVSDFELTVAGRRTSFSTSRSTRTGSSMRAERRRDRGNHPRHHRQEEGGEERPCLPAGEERPPQGDPPQGEEQPPGHLQSPLPPGAAGERPGRQAHHPGLPGPGVIHGPDPRGSLRVPGISAASTSARTWTSW